MSFSGIIKIKPSKAYLLGFDQPSPTTITVTGFLKFQITTVILRKFQKFNVFFLIIPHGELSRNFLRSNASFWIFPLVSCLTKISNSQFLFPENSKKLTFIFLKIPNNSLLYSQSSRYFLLKNPDRQVFYPEKSLMSSVL